MTNKRKSDKNMLETAFSGLFIKHKQKAKEIQAKLKQVKKELSENEFAITNTFEKMVGKQNGNSTHRNTKSN